MVDSSGSSAPSSDGTELLDKIIGIEVAATVGHSMGDVTENMHWRDIEEQYGRLDRMIPQLDKWKNRKPSPTVIRGFPFVYHVHDRPPGMSEDGHERHRLATTAVIEKGGRITVEDLARVWLRDIDPTKFGYLLGPQDQVIYYSLRAGIPPWEVGRYAFYPGAWGVTAMMVPIGIVNAGSPSAAARDALDVGRIKDQRGAESNFALDIASAVAAGVAAGMGTSGSVTSIIDAALAQLSPVPRAEVEHVLEWAGDRSDWTVLRDLLDAEYAGRSIFWPVETFATALSVLRMCGGDPTESVIAAVNLGRDADGRAFVAGALAATLNDRHALPADWEAVLTEQVATDPYTVSHRTPQETGDGLLRALEGNLVTIETQARLARSDSAPQTAGHA